MELPAVWRKDVLGSGPRSAAVVSGVRQSLSSAYLAGSSLGAGVFPVASVCPAVGVVYGRQGARESMKPRQWLNLGEVVQEVRKRTRLRISPIDFRSLTVAEVTRQLAFADIVLATPGAQWAAAIFLRANSLWLELVCPDVTDSMSWLSPTFRTREGVLTGGIAQTLGLRYVPISSSACPSPSARVVYAHWIPVEQHPWVASQVSRDMSTLSTKLPLLCTWRDAEEGYDLEGSATPRIVFNSPDEAKEACGALGNDCSAIVRQSRSPAIWALRRGAHGDSDAPIVTTVRKGPCLEVRKKIVWNATGRGEACESQQVCMPSIDALEAKTKAWIDWHSYNLDITVSADAVVGALDSLGCGLVLAHD